MTVLSRKEAAAEYGDEFVRVVMRGRAFVELTVGQRILLEKWKLMKKINFTPYCYEYVYVMAGDDTEFKIGVTVSPQKRLTSINTGRSDPIDVIALMVIGWACGRNIERALHGKYKKDGRHIRGEWFSGDAKKEVGAIVDFVRANYKDSLIDIEKAWAGNEPLMDMYMAAHKGNWKAEDAEKCRNSFLWVKGKYDRGELTILS